MHPYKLRLGVSGFTYKGGRKGENLFEKLTNSELSKILEFHASGSGWKGDFKHHKLKWDEMESYYRSLDMFLCTSLIEGIPCPPLEAMACGVPVIIPKNVGLLDELPDIHNIYRYKAGNYLDMLDAISKCIFDVQTGNINKQELRESVEKYHLNQWITDHTSVFENFLYNVSKDDEYGFIDGIGLVKQNEHPDWVFVDGEAVDYNTPVTQMKATSSDFQPTMGIYTVAYGKPAKSCFLRLLTSIRKHLGDLPVCMVSDTPLETELDYIYVEYPDNDIGARNNKTLIYDLAPKEWDYVLYLDSDTEIISEDALFLFDLLHDGFELVFCINPTNYILVSDMSRPDNQEEITELVEMLGTGNLVQLNGGVFAFRRNETTKEFFTKWNQEWNKYGKRDQAALDRVLYSMPVKLYTLGVEWNTVTRYYDRERSAAILHHPLEARRWSGRIDGRLDSGEAWASVHPERNQK